MAKPTSSGSITQLEKDKPKNKCRKWQLRVPVGVNPRTGKCKIKTRRFNGTWTEAKRALREFVIEIENDQVHQRAGTTVEACAESFMERQRASGEFTEDVFSRQGAEVKAAKRAATDLAAKRGADNIIVFGDFQRRKRGSTAPVQTPGRTEPDSNHPDCHEPFKPPNTQVDQQVS